MNDMITTAASGIAGAILAVLGLPHLVLIWGFIGAFTGLIFTPPETKGNAMLAILLSGLAGAALGNAAAHFVGGGDSILIAAGLIFGAGAKPILSGVISAVQARIKKAGDQ